jgi:hypothetical protein
MIRIAGGSVVGFMANDALERRAAELLSGCTIMAGFARGTKVAPDQREAGLLVTLPHIRNNPGFVGMAAEAVCAEFRPVDVRMT